jgi:hypothetical protein
MELVVSLTSGLPRIPGRRTLFNRLIVGVGRACETTQFLPDSLHTAIKVRTHVMGAETTDGDVRHKYLRQLFL